MKSHRIYLLILFIFIQNLAFADAIETINITLTIIPGPSKIKAALIYDSIPTGINISINGKSAGVTPYKGFDHRVGEKVAIELSDKRYITYKDVITLNSELTQAPPAELTQAKGTLLVTMDRHPENAKILIDGKAEGTVPAKLDLPVGPHTLSIQTAYQNSQTMSVDMVIGQTNHVMFAVTKAEEIVFLAEKINGYTKMDANGQWLDDSATEWQCVLDNKTGLIWEEKSNDGGLRDKEWKYSQDNNAATKNCYYQEQCDAHKYVHDVNAIELCGQKQWRLPTIFELNGLKTKPQWNVDDANKAIKILEGGGVVNPNIDNLFFPNTINGIYWSSTPLGYRIFGVDFFTGDPYKTAFRDDENYIRLVMDNHLL